jgi:hypothetical protein
MRLDYIRAVARVSRVTFYPRVPRNELMSNFQTAGTAKKAMLARRERGPLGIIEMHKRTRSRRRSRRRSALASDTLSRVSRNELKSDFQNAYQVPDGEKSKSINVSNS